MGLRRQDTADPIRRLDHVLLRLDQGKGMSSAKGGYEDLRRELLETDEGAIKSLDLHVIRPSPLRLLTHMYICRMSFYLHVSTPSSVPVGFCTTQRSLCLSVKSYQVSFHCTMINCISCAFAYSVPFICPRPNLGHELAERKHQIVRLHIITPRPVNQIG